jgi:ribose/xylose/arabinose/galactoside ABC-type transport system permease subunit
MIKAVLKGFTQKQEFVLFAILVVICTVFTIMAPFFLSAYNIGNKSGKYDCDCGLWRHAVNDDR